MTGGIAFLKRDGHNFLCILLLPSAFLPPSRVAVLNDANRITVIVKDTLAAAALAVCLIMAALAQELQIVPTVGNVWVVYILRRERCLVVYDEAPFFRRLADELLILAAFADKVLAQGICLSNPAPTPGFVK